MSKPNVYCGECPYWLAYGEPETTSEQNEAILAHCQECEFDPEAAEYLDKMMRAARQQIIFRKAIHGEGIKEELEELEKVSENDEASPRN